MIKWVMTIQFPFPSRFWFGLNNAYGSIVRSKGKRRYAQRFLLPDAVRYKRLWCGIFRTLNIKEQFPRFPETKECDKPLLVLNFDWILRKEDFQWKTGRLRGFDVSNLFKLPEDALAEYMHVDDSRTIMLRGQKWSSKIYASQCIVKLGFWSGSTLFEDSSLNDEYKSLLIRRYDMELFKGDLPSLISYDDLSKDKQEEVRVAINEHAVVDEVANAMIVALQEFKQDAGIILACVSACTAKNKLTPGLWNELVAIMKGSGKSKTPVPPEPRRPQSQAVVKGKFPFEPVPKAKMTREQFFEKWRKKNDRKLQYPVDMIDRTTGEINWDSARVYDFSTTKTPCLVFRYLITNDGLTYQELASKLEKSGVSCSTKKLNSILRSFISDPSWTPPGAGVFELDNDNGKMWIKRDPANAVGLTVPWMEEAQ